eukprot:3930588-Alexandrium_andersonii.AAC.1
MAPQLAWLNGVPEGHTWIYVMEFPHAGATKIGKTCDPKPATRFTHNRQHAEHSCGEAWADGKLRAAMLLSEKDACMVETE